MAMNELLKIQQGTIKTIEQELKEIKAIAKKAKKDVKVVGSKDITETVNSGSEKLLKDAKHLEKQLLILKFKAATPGSVAFLRKIAKSVREQKQLLLKSYPQV